jgi:hypothetical protein
MGRRFFAISGFLITSSWLGNPRLGNYFVARGLRILPGLWVCLVITAFVIAPVGVAIQGGPAAKLLLSTAPIVYVLKNCAGRAMRKVYGRKWLKRFPPGSLARPMWRKRIRAQPTRFIS